MGKLDKFIVDSAGQWKYPGKKTMIPNAGGKITMKGVKDVLLGIDDQGNKKIMLPGKDYQFPGNNVYEIPLNMKKQMGGAQQDQQMLMDMIQQYAQAIGADPNQIMQELQAAGPEEQQSMMEQITAAVQEGMPESNPYSVMQLGGAPEDHMFNPPMQEVYTPMDMEFMQVGGQSEQNKGYMNKTNNFVNWLKKKSEDVNFQKMTEMMQFGGNYVDQNGFYHNVNKEAAYMGMNNQQPNPQYGNYNPKYNPLSGGYSSLFGNTQQQPNSKLPRDLAINTTNNTTISKKRNPFTQTQNQTQTVATDDVIVTDDTITTGNNTTANNWQGEWYDPNNNTQADVTNPSTLSQGVYQGNNGYMNQNSYGYGAPNFNFGFPGFGGGLLNFIPNMIMALGSLGQMGRGSNLFNGKPGSGGFDNQRLKRDNRPLMNKRKTVGLDYSNDPMHKGDKGDGIKSLEQGKYPNPYMSYEDEIKLLAEQNAPTSADRTNKALSFLGKKRPMQFGGDPEGEEVDLENPDYFNLQYNLGPYGPNNDFLPDQDVTYTDPNANFAPAKGPGIAPPKSKGTGFGMINNPWAADELISDINSITAMKNQADMAKQDRLMKRDMNDVTKTHSVADKKKRGDWFSGPGLGYGMFRPDDNIYSGPNAFAKKGGTYFNGNSYQGGGESNEFSDYIEGDEMFLSDEQIQKILDAGGDIEFL